MSSPFRARSWSARQSNRAAPSSYSDRPVPPPRFSGAPLRPPSGRAADTATLELVEFEITPEPIADGPLEALPPDVRERAREAGQRVVDGDTGQIPFLEACLARFPKCPPLYNYLACAYDKQGDRDRAYRLIEETYRRFPDYLFGMCGYANLLLLRGQLDEVTKILKQRFSLHLWITHRRVFHVSEFVAFNSLMAQYFTLRVDFEQAEVYLKMLRDVAPDHPQTRRAQKLFKTSVKIVRDELRGLAKKGSLWDWLRRPRT